MKNHPFLILFVLLLVCYMPIPLIACTGCYPACTGECKTCVGGVCVDDSSKCEEGFFCKYGICTECDGEHPCQDCYICSSFHCVCNFFISREPEVDELYKCIDCNFTFTTGTSPPGGGNCIHWEAPDGNPESGTGYSFTTKWDEAGLHTVTASTCAATSEEKTVRVYERIDIYAYPGIDKSTGNDPVYFANDYYDEPSKRQQREFFSINPTFNPDSPKPSDLGGAMSCFEWQFSGVTVSNPLPGVVNILFINHGDNFWVDTSCKQEGVGRLDIAVEGIDLIANGIAASEEEGTGAKSYNISLNENFDQQLGSGPCYNVDHSDDTLTNDQMDEIGTITINTYTQGDGVATIRFQAGSKIKLFKSPTEKVNFDADYPASTFPSTLYIEGASAGTVTLTAILRTQEYPKRSDLTFEAKDRINIKVHRLNLKAVSPAPSGADDAERDRNEICDEDKLIIAVNNNDSDNDGIIDIDDSEIADGDPDFAKITLEKPAGTEVNDISGSITVTIPANLNAWKNRYKTGGAAPTSYSISDLPKDIYLEGKTASSSILDTAVKAEMTLNSSVKCRDEIKYTVVHLELKSIKFTSDHGVLNDNDSDWTDSGTTYSEPEWIPDGPDAGTEPEQNNPISHTKNLKLTSEVKVKVAPSGLTFDLTGDGASNYVDFTKTGLTSTGSDQTITIAADANLPDQVNTLEKSINWMIELTNPITYERDVGTSGPHKIYVTYGTPSGSVVTEKRMSWSCQEANGSSTDSEVADAIHNALGNVDPPREPSECDPGTVSNDWLLLAGCPYYGWCNDQANLMALACRILGVSASIDYVYPSSDLNCDFKEASNCPTHGYEELSGYTGFWNNFEGVCDAAGYYYAVWPKIKKATKVEILRTWLASPNYQGWIYWDDSDPNPANHHWQLCEIEPLP